MIRVPVEGTRYTLSGSGAGWIVLDGSLLIAGPFRTKGEALSAAIACEAVAA